MKLHLMFMGLFYVVTTSSSQYVERFRGIPLIKKPLYDPSGRSHFQCLDGSKIPFDWVNDDYCDCKDGSDEPGTSACSNGKFHCVNFGHSPVDIPSSRVNDMICDCCDGSDEWMGHASCSNYCDEAGKAAREESARLRAVHNEGSKKKSELVQQGKDTKSQNNKKLNEMRLEKETLSKQLEELDMVKQVAEKSENEAKDLHVQNWKAELELKNKEKQNEAAAAIFQELDVNKDNKVSFEEVTDKFEFDRNQDGQISDEEIKEYFGDRKETELEHFVNEMWQKLKDIYKQPLDAIVPQSQDSAAANTLKDLGRKKKRALKTIEESSSSLTDDEKLNEHDEDEPEVDVKEDEVEDFETNDPSVTASGSNIHPPGDTNPPDISPEPAMPDYDENTKKLIADAEQARKEYDDIKHKLQGVEDEIRRIEDFERVNFGAEDEFAHLYKKCFEYSDVEYTYGLCLFDRAYQKSSHGDVNLGSWDSWSVTTDKNNPKQLYKNGQSCWNGPSRSTEVTFTCGVENKLVNSAEPARCEYAMEFETPVVCSSTVVDDEHSEL